MTVQCDICEFKDSCIFPTLIRLGHEFSNRCKSFKRASDCSICEYKCTCELQPLYDQGEHCDGFKLEETKQTALNVQQGSESFD